MSPRTRTTLVAVVLLLVALAWEAFALTTNETGAWTFSRLFWALAENKLFLFLFGMQVGHFVYQKSSCLHCGFVPYVRTRLSEAAFDLAMAKLAEARVTTAPTIPAAKRVAGLPDFEVKQ